MTIFGRRKREPAFIDHAPMQVYMVHYVEHDRVIVCNAPTIQRAITFAQSHAHVIAPDDERISRTMMYDNDRICVMLYGTGMQYTCNIMRMPVHDHMMPAHITLAA